MSSMLAMLYKYYEKLFCYVIVLIATPGYYMFEMAVVRPKLLEMYDVGPVKQYTHIICSMICFTNVVGNMVMSIGTDCSLKKSYKHGVYCPICKLTRPLGSWHCSTCNACILRRDHHCMFLSRCIGLYNQRFFLLYLGHLIISMIYSFYYNFLVLSSMFGHLEFIMSALRIINPFLRFMIQEPMGVRDLYTFFLIVNVAVFICATVLFTYHIRNVLRGVTAYENKVYNTDMSDWKQNLVNVFGERWLLAMVFPFIDSPLPGHVKTK